MRNSGRSKGYLMSSAKNVDQSDNSPAAVPARLDVTADLCPMTFVRTKLALERLPAGALLAVTLRDGEARENVPRSAAAEGHAILSTVRSPDNPDLWTITIRTRSPD